MKGYLIEPPENSITISKKELVDIYRSVVFMRRLETAANNLYKQRLILGFCHLYNGQEAVCAGIISSMQKQDCLITGYREHTYQMTLGNGPKEVLAELLGRATGCSKGKGGSMHMYSAEGGFFGGNGIVGAQCPLGTGLAFAQKYQNTQGATFSLYGDGAANQGQIFEAYNMAELWKLPQIFLCENNDYGMGTSRERAAATQEFYTRGQFIPGLYVNGMCALSMKKASEFALDYCRSGKGPMLMEAHTYRYVGHSMSDPGTTYRSREEIQDVRRTRDPIATMKQYCLENDAATEEELKQLEAECKEEIDEAMEFAKNSPVPEIEETYTQVYKERVPVRGVNYGYH